MSGSLNKVLLIGNLGDHPEIKNLDSGKRLANFSIATSDRWKDDSGQKQEKTEWHRVVVFSQGLIGVIENYIKKGTKVYIEGSLRTRKWQDSNNQTRYSTEVVVSGFSHQIVILSSKHEADSSYTSFSKDNKYNNNNKVLGDSTSSSDQDFEDDPDDSIPF